jgi:hypothetical protein
VRRTELGQKIVERYREELQLDLPIRWPKERTVRRRRKEDVEHLRAHVAELCTEHAITKAFSRQRGYGRALLYDELREIHYPQIYSRKDYFVALHEIGHVVLGHRGPDHRDILQKERDAWDWALENARVKPTQAVRGMILRSLRSYGAD